MENKNKIEVRILGKDYVVKGLESDEYIQRVSLYIDKKMNEVAKTNHRLNTAMIAVLTAINVADDYFKNIDSFKELQEELKFKNDELDKTKAGMKEALEEISTLREKLTELQFELVKTKTELKDLLTNYTERGH
ncbi:MAG: cell division protein ZapA [Ignavibacteriales bacterium]